MCVQNIYLSCCVYLHVFCNSRKENSVFSKMTFSGLNLKKLEIKIEFD